MHEHTKNELLLMALVKEIILMLCFSNTESCVSSSNDNGLKRMIQDIEKEKCQRCVLKLQLIQDCLGS